ncbi:DASH complex subunit dam1 [Neofusicoccum ribis]|uniref:DASH complex subunit DAM1 n=1 Tax=Neofusicoccum ribis TaxID=45134 RepID=A0ABR3SEQ1_9PEZI
MADLEANFMHLQLMHESLARFSESFAAFLYGLNMNAFCVDFPEAPLPESFRRQRLQEQARDADYRHLVCGKPAVVQGHEQVPDSGTVEGIERRYARWIRRW